MDLKTFQSHFCEAIRPRATLTFPANLISGDPLQLKTRLQIYQNSSLCSLQKVLGSIYPACKKLVGDIFFDYMTQHYIAAFPHTQSLALHYGEHFPDFIHDFHAAQSVHYLAEMARYEWKWHRVFYAMNHAAVDFSTLAQAIHTQGEDILFCLPQGYESITSRYPLHEIWQTCQSEYQGDYHINFSAGPWYFMLWQQTYEVRVVILTPEEDQLVKILSEPRTLKYLCDTTSHNVAEILPKLYRIGCIRLCISEGY